MNSAFRRAIGIVAAVGLSACGGQANVPPAPAPASGAALRLPPKATPCAIPHLWHFQGSCAAFVMHRKGSAVTLAPYDNLTVTVSFTANNAKFGDSFIESEGTSREDITGRFKGLFPVYGSVACANLAFDPVSCPGKAFLYTVTENASALVIGWNTTPGFTIQNADAFPGTKCELLSLQRVKNKWEWLLLPVYGTPSGGAITLQPWPAAIALLPTQSAVFGVICF